MGRRKADHESANAERKLTPAQKKDKTARKLKEDCTAGVCVAVYRYSTGTYLQPQPILAVYRYSTGTGTYNLNQYGTYWLCTGTVRYLQPQTNT